MSLPTLARTLATVALLMCAAQARAQQTPAATPPHVDTILMDNGDRLSGEIKRLTEGRISFDSKPMGIVSVKWSRVVEITSVHLLEVETTLGERLLGTLSVSSRGSVIVNDSAGPRDLELWSIVELTPMGTSFWKRLDGSVNLGGSYTQSSGIAQFTFSSTTTARRPTFEWRLFVDSYVTVEEDNSTTERLTTQFSYGRVLPNRWVVYGMGQVDRNPELGFDVRSTIGAGAGRTLIRSNRSMFFVGAGLGFAREIPLDGDQEDQIPARFGFNQSYFLHDTPKTIIENTLVLAPILNQWGRWRIDATSSLTRELFKDFTIGFSVTESFDNRPSTEGAKRNDVAAKISIGYVY